MRNVDGTGQNTCSTSNEDDGDGLDAAEYNNTSHSNNCQRCKSCSGTHLTTQSTNDDTNEDVLSDYIQLKLELAEIQSQFQLFKADAKSKIELLERENASLLQKNAALQEENMRLSESRWFGRSRRTSLPERSCLVGVGQCETTSSESRSKQYSENGTTKNDKLLQGFPLIPSTVRKKDTMQNNNVPNNTREKAPNIANDNELYKQLQLHKKQRSTDERNAGLNSDMGCIQRYSNTSTSETSCETTSVQKLPEKLPPTQEPGSPIGDNLCFSIQPESVSSGFCEYSVVEPVQSQT
jgi:hypothetical protein